MSDDWRPEGWENPFVFERDYHNNKQGDGTGSSVYNGFIQAYEAGATAIVKAMWKLFDSNTITIYTTSGGDTYGYFCKGENNDDNNKTNL